MKDRVVVSYELTLPQNIYPKLDRLFSEFKWNVRRTLSSLWNEETIEKLKGKGSSVGILKSEVMRPSHLPSRFHRNVLELSGQIVRSQIERKRIYEYILEKPCRAIISENILAKELKTSPLFVLNIQRQVRKGLRRGKVEKDYLRAVRPSFSGNVVITSADDSLCRGQMRKLKTDGKFIEFEIKVPDGRGWRWIKVQKLIPDRLKKDIFRAKGIGSPLIKRVFLKSGYTIYKLVIPLELEVEVQKEADRMFAIDLSPSENRLGVGTVVAKEGHSKPIFFRASKMIKKLERLLKEISNLERKIDRIADQIHSTGSEEHREKLKGRLRHLYAEQRLRWRKFKELRKQVLEVFVNLVVEHARAYGCQAIAIEALKFSSSPRWKNPKMRRYFETWFYSKFSERLAHKAQRRGIRVIEVPAFYTSQVCHVCGRRGRAKGLEFECECGSFDRDYNASVNIGIRALEWVSGSKSEPYRGEDSPARFPFPQGTVHLKGRALLSILPPAQLLSYLKLVETSYLKLSSLSKYLQVDKYG
ncbi:transposase, IS605 OrfB family [Hydrogenobacter thermophilus TK-6]|uniref:Putative transposase n=1 Tax=Hydrogenobacter thermophilus (strain DSM 6534 / IAM 12695 / TK-6) TaxID=608538 RepID=D3DHN4_HYDTT|nr:RNA-guided endonuclease TnpB family protein [Hydrogenobacter thermophilus]ADO45273.1 transposase, IS605 OrfB family [Hydrogenobacter thermophilus TK-6]BAI69336.1 putative transposase [Hydrogenobacter thermophilus TK-6]